MRITELIENLEAAKADKGDVEVFVVARGLERNEQSRVRSVYSYLGGEVSDDLDRLNKANAAVVLSPLEYWRN